MADLKQLTLAGAAMDVPAALNDLSDVNAPSPVAGQVLTCGDGGIWSPRANQAAGFPGLAALDWQDPLSLGMTRGSLPINANDGQFLIAKFQNQVFFRMDSVKLTTNLTTGRWYQAFTNVPAEWLSPVNNEIAIAQTWGASAGGSIVAVCAGNSPSAIWIIPIVWNTGNNYLHGIVTWYV